MKVQFTFPLFFSLATLLSLHSALPPYSLALLSRCNTLPPLCSPAALLSHRFALPSALLPLCSPAIIFEIKLSMIQMSCIVCWQHFLISDFIKELSEDDIARCKFGRLKKDVVPSQHLPGDPVISSEDAKFALLIVEDEKSI